jgi:hypothetical protein
VFPGRSHADRDIACLCRNPDMIDSAFVLKAFKLSMAQMRRG